MFVGQTMRLDARTDACKPLRSSTFKYVSPSPNQCTRVSATIFTHMYYLLGIYCGSSSF